MFANNRTRKWVYDLDLEELHKEEKEEGPVVLFLSGLKLGANVAVDGVDVLTATNQFLTYNVTLDQFPSRVTLTFDLKNIDTEGRYMACSGGWDWAPYTLVKDDFLERPLFTFGPTGDIWIETVEEEDNIKVKNTMFMTRYLGGVVRILLARWSTTHFK